QLNGDVSVSVSGAAITLHARAPDELHRYLDHGTVKKAVIFPHSYSYVAAGSTFAGGNNNGITTNANFPLGAAEALTGHLHYGTFASGSGALPLAFRLSESPHTNCVTATVATNTGTLGTMARADLALPANSAREAKGLGLRFQAGATVTGPV